MPTIAVVRLVWKQAPDYAQADLPLSLSTDQSSKKCVFCEISDIPDVPVLQVRPPYEDEKLVGARSSDGAKLIF
jgi:hypothetical protein